MRSVPFKIKFQFVSASGEHREQIVRELGLGELAERVNRVQSRRRLGLSGSDCLSSQILTPHTDSTSTRYTGSHMGSNGSIGTSADSETSHAHSLKLLYVTEEATGGMHGPWSGGRSKLYLALCGVGITPDTEGRGGSYGYGKAGLIRGSKIRSLVAYTAFHERPDSDPGVTRRLLGMTYWGQHNLDDVSYTGSARLDNATGNATGSSDVGVPFCNAAADNLAFKLGMDIRDPSVLPDLGTTVLLVEPTVKPEDIIKAVERYWWPALYDPLLDFHVEVVDESGITHHPKPNMNPDLRPFIAAYNEAITGQQVTREDIRVRKLTGYKQKNQNKRVVAKPRCNSLGVLGIVAQRPGWSYPEHSGVDADSVVDHRSLVALVRQPRMVVEYYDAGRTPPYVRGAFIADDAINEPMRSTEPKSHDAWQTTSSSGDILDEHANIAKAVLTRIKSHVNAYRKDLKPQAKPVDHIRLPEFDRIMQQLFIGGGKTSHIPVPIPDVRDLSIRPGGQLGVTPDDRLVISGVAEIQLSDGYMPCDDAHDISAARDVPSDGDGVSVRSVPADGDGTSDVSDGTSDVGGVRKRVRVSMCCRFVEQDTVSEFLTLHVEPPEGFSESLNLFTDSPSSTGQTTDQITGQSTSPSKDTSPSNGLRVFTGSLKTGAVAKFKYHSEPYNKLWSAKLYVNAETL